jgi:hypothetical protein
MKTNIAAIREFDEKRLPVNGKKTLAMSFLHRHGFS